jgi:benzylsuccinate CoA-transferase BbsF subunit
MQELSKRKYSLKGPLAQVRVLDFTHTLAGSTSTLVLAAMGAEVIKVEHRKRIDNKDSLRVDRMRPWMTEVVAPTFVSTNYNKLGVTIDLGQAEGIDLVKKLTKVSDLVSNSFKPGTMDKYGIGYEELRKVKSNIVMISMSGHGATGPEYTYRGYAGIYSSLGGLAELVGYPDMPPTDTRSSSDFRAGLYGAAAMLAALNHLQRTGEGQFIDYSQREANICAVPDAIMEYTMNGRNASRTGNGHPSMAPHNCYPCKGKDRWISIAVGSQDEWLALCRVMGNPAWCAEERFSDEDKRWRNQEALDALIGIWTKGFESLDLMKILQEAGVAAMPSFDSKDLCEDPHLKEREAFAYIEHAEQGRYLVLSPPWKMSVTPVTAGKCFPAPAEDNDYVFGELCGVPAEELARLKEKRVI